MKTGTNLRLSLLAVAALFTFGLTGCGGDGEGGGDVNVSTEIQTFAIATEDKFKVPPGADPSVTAEMGGNGFEGIAEAQGWQTGTLTEDQLKLVASPEATKGGELKFPITDFPATFRAYGKDENSQVTRMIHGMVFEPLITVNPITLEFLPVLASHWKVDPDGQTYWFRIDPNARFSDGQPVTSDDIVATYNLAVDSTILSPATNVFYKEFDAPEVISKYMFKVHAKQKGWKNLLYFGGTSILPAHIIKGMSGKEYLEKFQYDMPPGSGPYVVRPEDINNGKLVSLTRRTNWWAAEKPTNRGQYNFDKVTLLVVRDERLELEKFKKGEVDLYLIRRAQWYEEEFKFDEVKRGLIQVRRIFTDEPQGVSGLVFNMRKPPFNDPKVREAFGYLFNREGLVKNLMYNAYLMTDSYYPGSVYENPNNPKIRYNPEKAAQLLAEAGYTKRNQEGILVNEKTGQPLVVEMPITEDAVRIMTPVQQDLKKAGVKLDFKKVDGPTQFKMLNERNFSIAYMNWGGLLYPNPKTAFHSELADIPNTSNLAGFKNTRADELIDREQITFEQEERVKILRELDSILIDSKQYALAWYAPFTRVAYWNKFGQPDAYLSKISDWTSIISSWWASPEKTKKLNEALKDKSINLGEGERDVKFWPEYNEKQKAAPVAAN